MFRKALLILSGNAAASLLLLARNLIVARMIPVADYGVAATFAMAMAVVEMASTLGLQQQIVQAKDGDDPRFQAALQGFQLLRGVIAGGVLLALAYPLASFLGIPEVAWAYQVLALVPVLNAAQHFDIHRLNRQLRFGPLMLTGVVPAVAALILVWPLAHWFGDWQVMLWSIIAQAVLGTITSHLVAERPWRLVWDGAVVAGSLRFGWPLLVNAGLMFLVFQGDKLIVGRVMGMEALAIFAMGMTLTLTPTLVLAKSAQNLFLPRLSQTIQDGKITTLVFEAIVRPTFKVHFLFGNLLLLVVLLLGAPFVKIVLGDKYAALADFLVPMAVLQGFRVFKGGASTVALAYGKTANPMLANLVRAAALPAGYWIAVKTGRIELLLWVAILAEVLGFLLSFVLAARLPGIPVMSVLPAMLAATTFQIAVLLLHGLELLNSSALGLAATTLMVLSLFFNLDLVRRK